MKFAREYPDLSTLPEGISWRDVCNKLLPSPNHVDVTLFSHKSKEYYTPKEYADAARAVMGKIDLDPASCGEAQKNIGAKKYYTKEDDGLTQDWSGRIWLNPPYSKTEGESNQAIWSRRLIENYESGKVTQAVLLVKAALGYKWFEELWDIAPAVCFARDRLSFILEDGTDDGQSKQGTAFFYFGNNVEKFIKTFTHFGRVMVGNKVYQWES
jgi:ParB family chromosome partitioning protein